LGLIAHIDRMGASSAPGGLDLRRGSGGARRIQIGDNDAGTLLRKSDRDRSANAAAGAGNDCDFVL
jgi:hypothetical protein